VKASSSSLVVASSSSAVVIPASSGVTTTATIPARIQAENYNAQSGIGLAKTSDVDGASDVASLNSNDYMEYSIYVPTGGNYTFNVRVNSSTGMGIQISGTAGGYMSVNSTNGAWSTVSTSLWLNAGTSTLRLTMQGSSSADLGLINWIEFVGDGISSSSTASSSATTAILSTGDGYKVRAHQGADLQIVLPAGHKYLSATFFDSRGHKVGSHSVQGLNSLRVPVQKAGIYFVRLRGNGIATNMRLMAL